MFFIFFRRSPYKRRTTNEERHKSKWVMRFVSKNIILLITYCRIANHWLVIRKCHICKWIAEIPKPLKWRNRHSPNPRCRHVIRRETTWYPTSACIQKDKLKYLKALALILQWMNNSILKIEDWSPAIRFTFEMRWCTY